MPSSTFNVGDVEEQIKSLSDQIGTVPSGKTVQSQITNIKSNASLLTLKTATSTNTQQNTYNSRKFSDYNYLCFILRDSNTTGSAIRNSIVIPQTYWSSGQILYIYANHGVSAENVSGVKFEYVSDTAVKIVTIGAGGLTGIEIVGLMKI